MSVSLVPAYGRRYEYPELALVDWINGKDFKIVGGPYCSIRDKAQLIEQFTAPIRIFWAWPDDVHWEEG